MSRVNFFQIPSQILLKEKFRTEKNVDKEDKESTDIKAFESLIKTFSDCVQVIKVVAIPHYQHKGPFLLSSDILELDKKFLTDCFDSSK